MIEKLIPNFPVGLVHIFNMIISVIIFFGGISTNIISSTMDNILLIMY